MSSQPQLTEQIGALLNQKLLDLLEQAYPLHSALPDPKDSDRMIWVKVGERRVVDFLRRCVGDAISEKVL